jgi:uncharacterized integral membrane protein (TIGR00698 family)
MEGVADWADVPASLRRTATAQPATRPRNAGQRALEWFGEIAPGVALAAVLAWCAQSIADWAGTWALGYARSPISGVPVAIIFGLLVCNAVGVPANFKAGLRFCATTLLRSAIVLLGLRLSLGVAAGIGWHALPVVLVCVGGALLLIPWLGVLAGLPRRLATLIAVGTGVCGVTAIVATAPAVGAQDDEISYAVACVAIFGLLAMLVHPWLAQWIFAGDVRSAGIFLGTAIHDTSQVAGAALTFAGRFDAPAALDAATVTKLMRNLCLAGAIPIVAWSYWRHAKATTPGLKVSWQTAFPLFVLGFVMMTLLRTIGDRGTRPFGLLDPAEWRHGLSLAEAFSGVAITMVMAAVGAQTDVSRFRRLGLRPLVVGFAASAAVGALSVLMLLILQRFAS